jgi:hypothetical protein
LVHSNFHKVAPWISGASLNDATDGFFIVFAAFSKWFNVGIAPSMLNLCSKK